MKVRTKPRHWIPLPLAVAWTVVAVLALADFSGQPAPRWREILLMILPPVTLAIIFLNLLMDRRSNNCSK
jgi:hypothetical protein